MQVVSLVLTLGTALNAIVLARLTGIGIQLVVFGDGWVINWVTSEAMFKRYVLNWPVNSVGILSVMVALSACELSEFLRPNDDADSLYTDPYIGLQQLNSKESRLMAAADVGRLRGQIGADQEFVSEFEGVLAAQAASVVPTPPGTQPAQMPSVIQVARLDTEQLEALTARQETIDRDMGIFDAVKARAEQIASEQAKAEEALIARNARVAELNRLANQNIATPREVEPVPQPEAPTTLADLFTSELGQQQPVGIVYFASRSSALGPRERAVIIDVARKLRGRNVKLRLRGFDSGSLANRTQADRQRAMDLSLARANAVQELLVQEGFDPVDIEVQAFGDQAPISPEDSSVGIFLNQRVEITARLE